MKLAGASASALLVVAAAGAVSGASTQRRAPQFSSRDSPLAAMARRSVTGNGNSLDGQTFDYVVVGGGLAGLVVANRLSENSTYTVAVIEAGADAYGDGQDRILVPAGNLYNSALRSAQDWNWQTTKQSAMQDRTLTWPRGKVLGGSSAVNGLYMVRASAAEHNAWGALAGAPARWGWDNMARAMRKSEHFVPPSQSVQEVLPDLRWNEASHGTSGSIYTSWPGVAYSSTNDFLQSMAATGTDISSDPDGGESWGAFVATSSINPNDWTRSFSRNGYLDTAQGRPNLSVLTGHTVTKILTDASDANAVKATGVQYSAASGQTVHTVNARREVIISGGAINSPQILQLSGIGDAQQLKTIGIEPIVDLPGVGHNLQDHLASSVSWSAGSGSYPVTGPDASAIQNSFVNSAIAYVNITTLFGANASTFIADARSDVARRISAANMRDEVKRAWNVTMTVQLNDVMDPSSKVGPIEILHAYVFGAIQAQVALQHPLSRGSVLATSADPFQAPAIDPQYLSADIDLLLMREGFKLARRVGQTQPLAAALGNEQSPGSGVQTDRQWEAFIANNAQTEYHPSSTCSQLPRADGGVVDANLLVYGTSNLRVVDASIVPIALSAHLMTATYGLAEVGAELIIEARTPPPSSTSSAAGSQQTGSTGGGSSAGNNGGASTSGGQSSGAAATALSVRSAAIFVCGAAVASLLL